MRESFNVENVYFTVNVFGLQTTERLVRGGDAAFSQIPLTTLLLLSSMSQLLWYFDETITNAFHRQYSKDSQTTASVDYVQKEVSTTRAVSMSLCLHLAYLLAYLFSALHAAHHSTLAHSGCPTPICSLRSICPHFTRRPQLQCLMIF